LDLPDAPAPPVADPPPAGADLRRREERPALPTPGAARAVAFVEVLLCSDYPTQIIVAQVLAVAGLHAEDGTGALNLTYVAALTLADTVLLVALIAILLRAHGEGLRRLLLGERSIGAEFLVGLPLTLVSLAIALIVLGGIQLLAPSLHTVEHNPLQDLLRTPSGAVVFGVIVVVAGGVREEIQRAFLLQRFERWLGGATVGVVVASIAFGAGHLLQGVDAAAATAVLGAFWGVVYLRRRSVVAPMTAHAGFNLLQVAQFLLIGR